MAIKYTVKPGDTLSEIALRFRTTWQALQRVNHIPNANLIYVGEEIIVPGKISPTRGAPAPYPVPHSVEVAYQRAQVTHYWPMGWCDSFCAHLYGFTASGYYTAVDNWLAVPLRYKHFRDRNGVLGEIAFFSGGSEGDGHACFIVGGENVISTDINGAGTVGRSTIPTIEERWGLKYLGRSAPYFQGQLVTDV